MKIVVTGASGFIGSNVISKLNKLGFNDIIAVDNLGKSNKFLNLVDLKISDYYNKSTFIDKITTDQLPEIDIIFHQGACSSTIEEDGDYMMYNNYSYSKTLVDYCVNKNIRFIYASSASTYGLKTNFIENPDYEFPLNVYGYSKLAFDNYVRNLSNKSQVVGLRYFNVYGPRESHKGSMASVCYHLFHQYKNNRKINLFSEYDGFMSGEQLRDFIYIEDVVDVNLYFFNNEYINGIYNVGSGNPRTFNDVALLTINSILQLENNVEYNLDQLLNKKILNYIDFPVNLKGKYQSFTKADLTKLNSVGYKKKFTSLEDGIYNYVSYLISK